MCIRDRPCRLPVVPERGLQPPAKHSVTEAIVHAAHSSGSASTTAATSRCGEGVPEAQSTAGQHFWAATGRAPK
eukprot:2198679-Alexandrium_andersonii.AAC.1